jgi:hypothetical protein
LEDEPLEGPEFALTAISNTTTTTMSMSTTMASQMTTLNDTASAIADQALLCAKASSFGRASLLWLVI